MNKCTKFGYNFVLNYNICIHTNDVQMVCKLYIILKMYIQLYYGNIMCTVCMHIQHHTVAMYNVHLPYPYPRMQIKVIDCKLKFLS